MSPPEAAARQTENERELQRERDEEREAFTMAVTSRNPLAAHKDSSAS